MKPLSLTELQNRSTRELAGLKEEFRKEAAYCEQQKRRDYAALENIRKVQGQRRIMRPNL